MTTRFRTLVATGLVSALHACGPQCPPVDNLDLWLDQSNACVVAPEPTPTHATCTPSGGTICTVIGTGVAGLGADNLPGTQTAMYLPQDVTVGPTGEAYYADWNNHQIRSLDTRGVAHVLAGSGELNDGDATENPQSMPSREPDVALHHRLNHPTGVAFDRDGRLLIAAWHSSEVKRLDLRTGMIYTISGTGIRGYGGDGGDAFDAVLNLPVAVALSPAGDMYIANQVNQRIRRVDRVTNQITTVVGTGGRAYSGDNGPATSAELNNPVGQAAAPAGRIAFDTAGNLYIANTGNNRIRRVDPAGTITTVVGTGTAGYAGDGDAATAAQLNGPTDVDVAADGTLYIADTQNSCIRAVAPSGTIRTAAGRCGMRGFSGDGASPQGALLNRPHGVGVDANNNLWVADTYNQRIRLVCVNRMGRCANSSSR